MTTQPLCVYRSSDVWICTVHASVCVLVSAKKSVCRHAKKATRACTLRQLPCTHTHTHTHTHTQTHTHTLHAHMYTHTHTHTHKHTHSSSWSPFSTLSWALPVTPHGDFALCQLSYSNKSLKHWLLKRRHCLQSVWFMSFMYNLIEKKKQTWRALINATWN